MEFEDGFEEEIRRQVSEKFDRRIEVPDGLSEDEAVASVIAQYKEQTGVDLPEGDVRAQVRKKMDGRDRT